MSTPHFVEFQAHNVLLWPLQMDATLALWEAESPVPKTATENSNNPAPSAASVLGFAGHFEPPRVSLAYKVGLVLVALGMTLLLAVYAGLIVFAALGVYYHLRGHSYLIEHSPNYVTVFAYLWPAAAGTVLVFFMIKPIFAGEPEQPPKYSLTAQSDPILFGFIAKICELVRAPLPSRVDVDCDINASASFRRGLVSLRGNDVVLTIGLPLAAGLTMQEFAGVLAHEFGHFAQGAGMRLTYVIRATSRWFARVVYERDQWDVWLARAAYSIDLRIGIFLHLIRFTVWLSRRILWVLMHLGHLFSCFMLRQMEYDADSYETRLAGSEAFARTSTKLHDLHAAGVWTSHKLEESWKNRRLPQNLPSFISISVKNIPAEMRKDLDDKAAKRKTRIFDTHPCDADRVRAAMALNEPGVFHSSAPASGLFKDFADLCNAATRFHYEHNLQLRFTDHNLVPHETTERESQSQADGDEALRKFFFGLKLVFRPILLPEDLPTSQVPGLAVEAIQQARQAMERAKPDVQKALAEYEQAEALYQRGYDAIRQQSQQATSKATATMQSLAPTLEAFEKNAQTRLICALQLLNDPAVSAKIPNAASLQQEAGQLRIVLARLGQAFGPLQELRRKFSALSAAIGACHEERRCTTRFEEAEGRMAAVIGAGHETRKRTVRLEEAEHRINELAPEIQNSIKGIRAALQETHYPFHHAREGLTLEEFARNDIPATHKLEALCNDCTCHLNRLLPLYQRVLSRLAFIAVKVEEHL